MTSKKYQTRMNGVCIEHDSLAVALQTTNEKVSFTEDGMRVILRADGTWEVLGGEGESGGVYTGSGFVPWEKLS